MKKLVYRLLVYGNIVLVASLLLSYLSVHISPEKLWLAAFFGLAYPYLLLFNLMFCLFWMLFAKRVFLISLLAILIGWNFICNHFQIRNLSGSEKTGIITSDRQKRQDEHQLKILSFNIRAFNLYNWNQDQQSLNSIINYIRDEDPDLICLQEFYAQKTGRISLQDIYDQLDNTPYRHLHHTLGEKQNNSYGIATFSSYPIINQGFIAFDNTINICIYTDIKVNTDTLRVYNNHLQSIQLSSRNFTYLDSIRLRYNEDQINELKDISYRLRDAFIKRAMQAARISDHINGSPHAVIVCGDFNDTPSSYTYYKIRKELLDAFVESGSGFGNTYAGKFPSFRIDYILHHQDIKSIYYKRTRTALSDHYPITAYLQLN